MASVLSSKACISTLPENLLLEIFSSLPVKDLCTVGRVCCVWRRVTRDNSLWRHVDLRPYKLKLHKMWKVIRAHFSDVLLSLHLKGHMDPAGVGWHKNSLSDAMLTDLQERCPNMVKLELIQANLTNVTVTCLPKKLQRLIIIKSMVPAGWFHPVQRSKLLKCLKYVDLSYSTKTCNSDLKDLSCITSIRALKINGCYRVTEAGIVSLAEGLTKLECLELEQTGCSDLNLHIIGRNVKNLTRLNLMDCKKITDGGVASIVQGCKDIQWLSFSGCDLSDVALLELEELKKLQFLDMTRTQITDDEIQNFMDKHPSCTVKIDLK